MAQRIRTDWILFVTVLTMVSFGVLIVYSASSVMAELRYGSSWHFAGRQALWAINLAYRNSKSEAPILFPAPFRGDDDTA